MPVLKNIGFLATCRLEGRQGDIHPIKQAALAWEEGKITWIGKEADLPPQFESEPQLDVRGRMVIPGLVECHTHLGFGGWRSEEFEQRLLGRSYLEIAEQGGGILATVEATREATEEELSVRCLNFLSAMSELGITTVEAKSGYGLNLTDEIKLLRVYRQLREQQSLRIISTCLAAHTVPPEYRSARNRYVDLICERILPDVAEQQLAEFCDVFVERTAFSLSEARRILKVGKQFGLLPKLHVDQITDGGGAQLASELGAVSADHLEKASERGIDSLADSEVIAVALPISSLYLQQNPMPARRFIDRGIPVAVSTDFNPGTAPSYHLPLAMMLICNLGGMTPSEALKAVTINAARALNLQHKVGSLELGKYADLAIIDAPDPNHWMYHFCPNRCVGTFVRGEKVYSSNGWSGLED